MSLLLYGDSWLRKIQSVRPDRLISLFPQNEPLGHAVSTEIIRGRDGVYTLVTLGQPGLGGLTSAGYNGVGSFNNIHTPGFANDNGLLNSGFETPGALPPVFLNWDETVGDGAIASDAVIFHEGADSARLTSGLMSNTAIRQNHAVIPGQRRRFRIWTRGDGANDGRYEIWDFTHSVSISGQVATGVTAAVWGMIEVEYTVPVGCVTVREYFYCPAVNGGIAWFDACEDRRTDGFLGDKGTIIVPAQVANAGVWTDGINRYMVHAGIDANNRAYIRRGIADNQIQFVYSAGGVLEIQSTAGLTNLDFAIYGITWDISAGATGEVRYYIRGIPNGAMDVGLGTWVGDLNPATTVLGAESTIPGNVWSGNEGPVPVWSEALSPDEMRHLGTP